MRKIVTETRSEQEQPAVAGEPLEICEYIGLDVHKKDCQLCVLTKEGTLVLEQRFATTRARLQEVLGTRARARIVLESSTESEWVARCLEGQGHEVVVADPNFAPMYAYRHKKQKTDKRDARTLAEAARLGAYRPAHRLSDQQRQRRSQLQVRDTLVKTRTRYIGQVRALLRQQGYRVEPGEAEHFVRRVERLDLPEELLSLMLPLLRCMDLLNEQIEKADQALKELSKQDEQVQRLCTAPFIGPVTATAVVAAIDGAQRFQNAHQVESYLGLVPRQYSSGEKQRLGSITKAGNPMVRWLLVECAQTLLRCPKPQTMRLWQWAHALQQRRGKNIAVVALARRMAGILWAMLRHQRDFEVRPVQTDSDEQRVA